MKFKVQMKDPDTLHDAIADAVGNILLPDLSEEEAESVREIRRGTVQGICSKWFEHGEYLTVEIDTDEKTCVVVPYR